MRCVQATGSGVDCLVAACAERHHLRVVHRDRDYASIARVAAIEHTDISPRLKRSNTPGRSKQVRRSAR